MSYAVTIQIRYTPNVKTGSMIVMPDMILIGTGQLSEIEAARYHAKYLVNKGLRDVVEWLGECPLTANPANNIIAQMRHLSRKGHEFQDGSVI